MIDTPTSTPKYPGVLPPPPGVTPDANFKQSGLNILTQTACITVTSIFLFLRLYTKHVTSNKYYSDDCPLGIGIHMWNVSPENFRKAFQLGYVLEVLYGPVILLTKLAILQLLIRIFNIKKRFVFSVRMLIGVLALYYIAITLVKIFICKPVEKFWNHKTPGKCLNTNTVFISDCVVSLVTDFVILVSPLPVIWNLQMDLRRKLGSSVALAVGAIACVASILRLEASVRTMDDIDKSYVFGPILLYSCGEIAVGVICGCIPVLPALYRYYCNKGPKQSRWNNTESYGSGKEGLSRKSHKGMLPLEDLPSIEFSPHAPIVRNADTRKSSWSG
ncbi:hypothetical protein K458DRAFT_310450 [Lentithecium fluviatile CBS 122367]|uniref:Rhodopsin domain-containing protein n=1 Tax=Lentithecium fluviatile CBS 122367 TaxID=1168545 RepID=A0A6G1IT64_9PLEO|nr:hypothetical protein K458DRAFT_310450 [Lentithecium fluviatile CBS 122367]